MAQAKTAFVIDDCPATKAERKAMAQRLTPAPALRYSRRLEDPMEELVLSFGFGVAVSYGVVFFALTLKAAIMSARSRPRSAVVDPAGLLEVPSVFTNLDLAHAVRGYDTPEVGIKPGGRAFDYLFPGNGSRSIVWKISRLAVAIGIER